MKAAVEIRRAQLHKSRTKKKQKDDMLTALSFIETHLVYHADHERLRELGVQPGSSFLLDDAVRLDVSDLEWFVEVRRSTNLRTKAANERRRLKWEEDCRPVEYEAERLGIEPVLPDRPDDETENVATRTERYTWQVLGRRPPGVGCISLRKQTNSPLL